MARYVLDWPEVVRGKSVLDFASGSGLVGIAAARAGAARVEACDLDPFARAAVELNAQLNGVAIGWREGDLLGGELPGVDVVLAGDVFYERALSEACLAWLSALRARGVLALVGDPGRLYTPREGLLDWASYDVPTSAEIEQAPFCGPPCRRCCRGPPPRPELTGTEERVRVGARTRPRPWPERG